MPRAALVLPGPGPQDRSSAKTRGNSKEAFSRGPRICTLVSTTIAKTMRGNGSEEERHEHQPARGRRGHRYQGFPADGGVR